MAVIEKRMRIGGMTCVNCQNKIERKLKNTAGVQKADVSYSTGTADITYDSDIIGAKDLIAVIERLDYQVLPEEKKNGTDSGRMIGLLVIIVALYFLLQQFGILNLLVPSQLADTKMGYGMLFVVGLLTSVHCIAMCGGINLSQCIGQTGGGGEGRSVLSSLLPSFLYNLGRVISYTVIGFLLGLAGMLAGGGSGTGLPALFQGILKLAAGVIMVIMGLNMLGIFPWLRRFNLRMPAFLVEKLGKKKLAGQRPLVVGLINGLMPCGPLQSMQIVALASGNPLAGALSMLLFSLGTVPLMLGLGSLVAALGRKFSQAVLGVGAVLVTVLGLAMMSQGGSLSGLLLPDRLLALILAFCVLGAAASIPFSRIQYRVAGVAAAAVMVLAVGAAWGDISEYLGLSGYSEAAGVNGGDNVSGIAEIIDGVQVVNSTLEPGHYPNITVQAGIPVKWVIDAPSGSINGCNYKMLLNKYAIEHEFHEGENVITFTPQETGTVDYTCWMGMIHGTITVTNENGTVPASSGAGTDYNTPALQSYGAGCCGTQPTSSAGCCGVQQSYSLSSGCCGG